ncbi:hypothetical protein [uncultured Paludibaculum sp.]|uniref:phage major capsid protein n=1 Tax=uncultured Paludibaculum sp. TaxID=1765020 RepID=UPI002AABF9DE|nr:hypothetical protein [uncultured Paludibaculum sp.]
MNDNLLTRAATFEPSTFDAERNSVQVVFSTGADVQRNDFEGPFIERLAMTPEAVNLTELIGAPVLNAHNRFDVRDVLGVVEEASVDGARGVARIRFGQRPDVQGIATDVKGGIIRSVSAGYSVQEWRTEKRPDGTRLKTAVRWTPKEISFTPLAADPQAKTRSMGDHMEPQVQDKIRSIAEAVGVAVTFADDLIQRNLNLNDARTAIIQEAARTAPKITNHAPAQVTRETAPEDMTRAAGEALYQRLNPAHRLSEQARPFAGRRIADLYREVLRQRGHSALGSDAEIVTRAMHTISDFSSGIFSELFNKSLFMITQNPAAITQVFKRATVDDFRDRHVFEISDGPALVKVNETGEVKSGTITDKKLSSYHIDSYARLFSLSFQAQVNDDMGALADLSAKMTRGARQWFTSLLVDAIIANPKLADNKAVFHADHGNLAAAGAVPGETTLAAAKLAMRTQVDASGNPIDAPPKFIVIPAALETTVDKLIATLYPQAPADAIVSARGLISVPEPRLDLKGASGAWYLFADPSMAPVFEYAELSGYEGPQVEVKQGWETLGTEIRVVWHVGAGAIDSRGAWKNPGA